MANVQQISCYIIGITGKSGSGKTTVANILKKYDFPVFDVDCYSKQFIKNNPIVFEHLNQFINITALDFKKIGKFFDIYPDKEKEFNIWYQPFIGEKIKEYIFNARLLNSGLYFFDIPQVVQKEIIQFFDHIWLLETNDEICFERIKRRNKYSDKKIYSLIEDSSMTISSQSHTKIFNNGTIGVLEISILKNIEMLKKKFNIE